MPARVALVDHPGETPVEGDLLEVDVRDVELLAERLPHRLVGDVVQLEEHLAQRHLQLRLLGEGVLELGLADGPALEEDLAEPSAPVRRGGASRLVARACGYLAGGHSRGVSGWLAGAPRRPTAAASRSCTPRFAR